MLISLKDNKSYLPSIIPYGDFIETSITPELTQSQPIWDLKSKENVNLMNSKTWESLDGSISFSPDIHFTTKPFQIYEASFLNLFKKLKINKISIQFNKAGNGKKEAN